MTQQFRILCQLCEDVKLESNRPFLGHGVLCLLPNKPQHHRDAPSNSLMKVIAC